MLDKLMVRLYDVSLMKKIKINPILPLRYLFAQIDGYHRCACGVRVS